MNRLNGRAQDYHLSKQRFQRTAAVLIGIAYPFLVAPRLADADSPKAPPTSAIQAETATPAAEAGGALPPGDFTNAQPIQPKSCREVIGESLREQGSLSHADPMLITFVEESIELRRNGGIQTETSIIQSSALRNAEPRLRERRRLAFTVTRAIRESSTHELCSDSI